MSTKSLQRSLWSYKVMVWFLLRCMSTLQHRFVYFVSGFYGSWEQPCLQMSLSQDEEEVNYFTILRKRALIFGVNEKINRLSQENKRSLPYMFIRHAMRSILTTVATDWSWKCQLIIDQHFSRGPLHAETVLCLSVGDNIQISPRHLRRRVQSRPALYI